MVVLAVVVAGVSEWSDQTPLMHDVNNSPAACLAVGRGCYRIYFRKQISKPIRKIRNEPDYTISN